jgi:hypothetical protein
MARSQAQHLRMEHAAVRAQYFELLLCGCFRFNRQDQSSDAPD